MVSITLSVPPEIKSRMEKFEEINWSAFIRKCIAEKTKELEHLKQWVKEDKEMNLWAVKLQKKSRKGRFEALKKKGLV